MREKIRDKERLLHIIEAIEKIQNHTPAINQENLKNDALIFYGIVKCIEIIGEAVYKLSSDFKESHPQTAWDDIEGMRHVLVHDYYQIQPDRVWEVISSDLPQLKIQIEQYIAEMK